MRTPAAQARTPSTTRSRHDVNAASAATRDPPATHAAATPHMTTDVRIANHTEAHARHASASGSQLRHLPRARLGREGAVGCMAPAFRLSDSQQ